MIVRETFNPDIKEYRKLDKKNGLFYYLLLQDKNKRRYLKIGTTEQYMKKRLGAKDYKKYTFIKVLYLAECDKINDIYDLEDINRTILRNTKGMKWHKNDRFTYFRLPEHLPRTIKIVKFDEIPLTK